MRQSLAARRVSLIRALWLLIKETNIFYSRVRNCWQDEGGQDIPSFMERGGDRNATEGERLGEGRYQRRR